MDETKIFFCWSKWKKASSFHSPFSLFARGFVLYHNVVKPGGVILVTLSGYWQVSKVSQLLHVQWASVTLGVVGAHCYLELSNGLVTDHKSPMAYFRNILHLDSFLLEFFRAENNYCGIPPICTLPPPMDAARPNSQLTGQYRGILPLGIRRNLAWLWNPN